jgi:Tfp pilus assembly protein PilO
MPTLERLYQRKRVWLGGGLVLTVVILLIGWYVVMDPVVSDTAAKRDQIESVQNQNAALGAKNAKLEAADEDVAALRDSLVAALAELPADGGIAAFTRQLSSQASARAVALRSVIVANAAPIDDSATGKSGADGLLQITVTVSAEGTGAALTAFLSDIQVSGPRRALVTSTQLAPAGPGTAIGPDAQTSLNLTLTVFTAPLTTDEQAALEKLINGS